VSVYVLAGKQVDRRADSRDASRNAWRATAFGRSSRPNTASPTRRLAVSIRAWWSGTPVVGPRCPGGSVPGRTRSPAGPPGALVASAGRSAGAVRAPTREPDPPNERSPRPTTRTALDLREASRKPAPISLFGRQHLQRQNPQPMHPLFPFRERSQTLARAKPCLAGPHGARTAPNVPRRNPGLHVGEALFGGNDLQRARRLARSESDPELHAWAKPCLAGRPTALVRTQCCETNTSRSRPSGMELPDYPVVVLTPCRRTRMGPHFRFPPGLFPYSYLVPLPAGSFPRFVPRSASRRVFSQIRSSFRFPPGLFPDPYLVLLPIALRFLLVYTSKPVRAGWTTV
jgi:hypothetical protein